LELTVSSIDLAPSPDKSTRDAAFLQTSTFADEIVAALTDEISNALAHSHENRHDG
jgi:hypothetical protein